MKRIKTGDQVIVTTGKDKGKQGTVTKILSNGRCYVAGVQMIKRHTKPNPNLGQPGGIIEKEAAIHISNVAIFNPEKNAADRVTIQVGDDGMKKRVFSSNNESVD